MATIINTRIDDVVTGIQWTDKNGNDYRAVIATFSVTSLLVVLHYQQKIRPVGTPDWLSTDQNGILRVTNENYRNLNNSLAIAYPSEALNEDGTVKPGYVGEFDLFEQMFGIGTFPIPAGIGQYAFMCDALARKFSQPITG